MGSAMFVPVVFCTWVVTVLALTLTGAYGVQLSLCMHLIRLSAAHLTVQEHIMYEAP